MKVVIAISIAALIFIACSDKQLENALKVNFPTHIYLEKKSADGKINAVIYSWLNGDKENFLGSDERFILGFISNKSKWYVDYELSEGQGTYEGGITEIQWLNDHEVLISDSFKNIKYNICSNEWELIKEKE